MIKKDILSTPKHGWCNFHLADEEKEFTASLSYRIAAFIPDACVGDESRFFI